MRQLTRVNEVDQVMSIFTTRCSDTRSRKRVPKWLVRHSSIAVQAKHLHIGSGLQPAASGKNPQRRGGWGGGGSSPPVDRSGVHAHLQESTTTRRFLDQMLSIQRASRRMARIVEQNLGVVSRTNVSVDYVQSSETWRVLVGTRWIAKENMD